MNTGLERNMYKHEKSKYKMVLFQYSCKEWHCAANSICCWSPLPDIRILELDNFLTKYQFEGFSFNFCSEVWLVTGIKNLITNWRPKCHHNPSAFQDGRQCGSPPISPIKGDWGAGVVNVPNTFNIETWTRLLLWWEPFCLKSPF